MTDEKMIGEERKRTLFDKINFTTLGAESDYMALFIQALQAD